MLHSRIRVHYIRWRTIVHHVTNLGVQILFEAKEYTSVGNGIPLMTTEGRADIDTVHSFDDTKLNACSPFALFLLMCVPFSLEFKLILDGSHLHLTQLLPCFAGRIEISTKRNAIS